MFRSGNKQASDSSNLNLQSDRPESDSNEDNKHDEKTLKSLNYSPSSDSNDTFRSSNKVLNKRLKRKRVKRSRNNCIDSDSGLDDAIQQRNKPVKRKRIKRKIDPLEQMYKISECVGDFGETCRMYHV